MRVGFRVLNPIKKNKFIGEFFINDYAVPGFRKTYNYTIIKTINIHVLPSTFYVNTSQDGHVDITCTYVY